MVERRHVEGRQSVKQSPNETRMAAELPGVSLELRHRAAERLAIVVQANGTPALPDPVALWAWMLHAAWAPWLTLWGAGFPHRLR
jgi:hypothetical protein